MGLGGGISELLVLDVSQLRNVTLNDEALMREVVAALVSEVSQQIDGLSRAVQRGDAKACITVAHNAYGACGNVGAASMAAVFYSIERQAAEGNLEQCQSHVETLNAELEKLRREADSM
jgi:HPt (histidine-containing phosphotransfer) domain-containing protein